MKRIRGLATILYYLSRMVALLCLATTIYAFLILGLSSQTNMQGLPIEVSGGYFTVFFPFSGIPFLVGDDTASYMITSMSTMMLYGIFLWLLSAVFKAFMQKKIFVPISVKRLKHFYLFNFFAPVIYIICLVAFRLDFRDALIIAFLHMMIGVFNYFMAIIFQQGLVLQEEQDLTF
ncbi:MAG TPA: DUF2975 domain-containing protein [Ferruginibacter sp.]|nr:DUF2975 domain-containing protein [Ferruginibacter sp.]